MSTLHVTEAEAARDLPGLLAQVRAGNEVVIESEAAPAVVLRTAIKQRGRTVEDSLAILEAREKERGYPAVMDEEFAGDMRDILANRRPSRSVWSDE